MAQTPQEFFEKNMKWFALAFFILFLFKSAQNCTRNMGTKVTEKQYHHTIDSLNKKVDILVGEKKQLTFELKLQNEKAQDADKRASAIQSVAEKMKSNTTVNIRGAQIDSTKRK